MNWLEHEYLIPIIIGKSKRHRRIATEIYRRTRIRVHFFNEGFSFFQRLTWECHTVSPLRSEFLVESLISFIRSQNEYYFPVLIICDDSERSFIEENSEMIESVLLVVDGKDIFD